MKCPKCAFNHPKKEGAFCGQCGREFVFYPPAPGGPMLVHVTEHMAQVSLVLWLAT